MTASRGRRRRAVDRAPHYDVEFQHHQREVVTQRLWCAGLEEAMRRQIDRWDGHTIIVLHQDGSGRAGLFIHLAGIPEDRAWLWLRGSPAQLAAALREAIGSRPGAKRAVRCYLPANERRPAPAWFLALADQI